MLKVHMHPIRKPLLELGMHCLQILTKGAVIKHLAKLNHFSTKKKVSSKALSKETKKAVLSSYKSDDILHQAPCKRDVATTRDEEGKQKLQKQHLTMGLMGAHSVFKQEHPQEKIGKSSFAALQPPDALLTSELPRNVCVYKHLILLLECLHKFNERFLNTILAFH